MMPNPDLSAVIPPVVPARSSELPRWNQRGPLSARPPLPVLKIPAKRVGSALYGVCALDAGGRLADRPIMTALGWGPGIRLEIRVSRGLIAVCAEDRGIFRVTAQRFVHLPVAARRWCGLQAGCRVLLAAYPEGGLLVVHPPAMLDDIVAQAFTAAWDADRP